MTCGTADAEVWLNGLYDVERTGRMGSPTLVRIAALVEALDHPERSYQVVHVTGTNGKGSTSVMAAALLHATGLRVGLYTSPHLEHPTERIALDGRPLTSEQLWAAIAAVADAAGRAGISPTWFEAMTAAGLWWFRESAVDVAVVEVGMLGRWDATNVVHGDIAVVTNVALDHADVAGPTLAHIAAEKAGIIEEGATLVLGKTDPELRELFEREQPGRVLASGGELVWSGRRSLGLSGQVVDLHTPWAAHVGVSIGPVGIHQCDNALLAVGAAEALLGTALPEPALGNLAPLTIPGRMELLAHRPTIVVDGAHNPAGAAALRAALAELDAEHAVGSPRILLSGMLGGRDPKEYLRALDASWFDLVIATEPPSPRALPASELAESARAVRPASATSPAGPVIVEPAVDAALALARESADADGFVIGAGSLYLVASLHTFTSALVGSCRAQRADRRRHPAPSSPPEQGRRV